MVKVFSFENPFLVLLIVIQKNINANLTNNSNNYAKAQKIRCLLLAQKRAVFSESCLMLSNLGDNLPMLIMTSSIWVESNKYRLKNYFKCILKY